jgi:S-DNA-T family DNA segregation ATPase FtsK/SpoIIIE
VNWLGFTGSALVFMAGGAGARRWCSASPGATSPSASARAIDGFIESRREKREIAEDLAMGSGPPASARRRCPKRKSASRARNTIRRHPVLIEPPVQIEPDVPKSERVAKERQKPLFKEMPDSKLPQVDLLDGAQRAAGNGLPKRWR